MDAWFAFQGFIVRPKPVNAIDTVKPVYYPELLRKSLAAAIHRNRKELGVIYCNYFDKRSELR